MQVRIELEFGHAGDKDDCPFPLRQLEDEAADQGRNIQVSYKMTMPYFAIESTFEPILTSYEWRGSESKAVVEVWIKEQESRSSMLFEQYCRGLHCLSSHRCLNRNS